MRGDFIHRRGGMLYALYCRPCGMEIAGTVRGSFRRHSNYAEIKIEFEDGSFHVTHLCKGCVNRVLDAETLQRMYDIEGLNDDRRAKCVAAVDTKFRGIA